MKAAILSIGTEITRGEIQNTNATWLCAELTGLGATVTSALAVDDDPTRIRQALRTLAADCNVIISTGGLGPTTDDLTAQTVAELLDVPLQTDIASLSHIKRLVEKHGFQLTASNAKQADLPNGSTALPNNYGSAPGFAVTLPPSCRAFFLPGVPREMRGIFVEHIAPQLALKLGETRTHQELLRVFGMPESLVNDTLAGIEETYQVTVGYRAHFPEVLVKSLAVRSTAEEAATASRAAADEIARRLGDKVYARGDTSLVATVGRALQTRGWTLGLAESCTGGLVASLITQEPASHYFSGAIVCYSNEVKRRVLDVKRETLDSQGAVSEATVVELAQGVRNALNCDVGLAFSGIAGPSGGTETKPVGLVHYAVCTPNGAQAREQVFSGNRQHVQRRSAYAGLDLLRRMML